ncbi:hypothetical protein [Haloglomus halophilum]|uniref:hypothetical protein n=1 Tax=Haloglomus halophilum TaxID=2962672 RepID=UPI0020C9D2BB|nr:hypothetical protein [Haloglomus halophilum]
MSTVGSVSIDEAGGSVTIDSLQIEDEELCEFLLQHEESEYPEKVSQALTIGMKTMQLMDTSQEVEYVERRLSNLEDSLTAQVEAFQDELQRKLGDDGELHQALDEHMGEEGTLESRIEAAFDDDGPFVERLNEELGEDGERIQAALDPDKEGSPTHRLEQRLKNEIESIRDKIVEEETEADLRSRTYLKGGDFEDSVHDILNEIVRQTPNNVEFTGDTTGETGREVGDFVFNLADTDQKIAVEAKTEYYPTQDIKDEMEAAIQNRDAAYGVFVTDTLENLPSTKTGWFHEFPDQNTVVVALSETAEDEIEPGYLRIAMSWARMRAVQAHAEVGSDFDPEDLRAELNEIESDLDRFKAIRGQCTEIKNSRERIETTLSEIERDITARLGTIEAELSKAGAD